jgi:PIN domain nuclease of toxin-antitoxin system
MGNIVADTHVALWILSDPERLSAPAIEAVRNTVAAGDLILVASISVVEVIYLVEKGRLPATLYDRLIDEFSRPDTSFSLVSLDFNVSQTLRHIAREAVPDMPDRIIAATAPHLGLPLVTRDEKIRAAALNTIW